MPSLSSKPLPLPIRSALTLAALLAFAAPARAQRLPLNPEVAALLSDISAERIERRLCALVGFGTRHTLSDTESESETRRIGAARRRIAHGTMPS